MLRLHTLTPVAVLVACLLVVGCSPRNGFESDEGGRSSGAGLECAGLENGWPELLPEHESYVGEGANTGDLLGNFLLEDQNEQFMCFSQLLGYVLVIDASTRWCAPCNAAAEESPELWEEMKDIGPSWFATLMVQNKLTFPATHEDVAWWAETYGLEYPVLLDDDQQTAAEWGVTSFPLFLFVAPTGEIVERHEARPTDAQVLDFVSYAVQEWAGELRPQSR